MWEQWGGSRASHWPGKLREQSGCIGACPLTTLAPIVHASCIRGDPTPRSTIAAHRTEYVKTSDHSSVLDVADESRAHFLRSLGAAWSLPQRRRQSCLSTAVPICSWSGQRLAIAAIGIDHVMSIDEPTLLERLIGRESRLGPAEP